MSGVVAVDARQEASGDCAGLMAASGLMTSSLQSSSIGLDGGSARVEHAALGSLPTARRTPREACISYIGGAGANKDGLQAQPAARRRVGVLESKDQENLFRSRNGTAGALWRT